MTHRRPFAPLRSPLTPFIAAAALLAALPLTAQTPPRTLALTESSPFLAQLGNNCNGPICTPALPAATLPYAGGVAHDPRDRNTWVSDGTLLAKVDPRGGCSTACPPIPVPNLVAGEVLTGLAFNEETQQLFVSHSDNRILTFTAVGCALSFVSACTVSVPPNHVVSGLATDDSTGRLYYASSPWLGASSVPFGQVYTAPQTSPCTPFCPGFGVPDCSGALMSEITGLGFDVCRGTLQVTDGRWVVRLTLSPCQPSLLSCCPAIASLGERLIGLCTLPSTEVSSGTPCVAGTATACASMQHMLRGDPTIGNLGFALDLLNAPANTTAFVNIQVGNCLPGTTYSGILCTAVPTTILGWFIPTGGSSGCTGSATWPFPIPNLPVLCGITLSSRYWGIDGPPSNNYVSNCLTWTISSS